MSGHKNDIYRYIKDDKNKTTYLIIRIKIIHKINKKNN